MSVVSGLALQLGCFLCSQVFQLLRPCKSVRPKKEDRHDVEKWLWATLVNVLLLVVLHPCVVSAGQLAGRQLLRCKFPSIWRQLLDLQLLSSINKLTWQLRHGAALLQPCGDCHYVLSEYGKSRMWIPLVSEPKFHDKTGYSGCFKVCPL